MSSKHAALLREDEEVFVRNLDTGEKLTPEEASARYCVTRASGSFLADSKESLPLPPLYFTEGSSATPSPASSPAEVKLSQLRPAVVVSVPRFAPLQPIRISGHGMTKDEENKPFTVYFIEVRCDQAQPSSWTVYRRYQQFRRLNDGLRAEAFLVPVLPPRKLIGQMDPEFIKQRQIDLELWLHQLLDISTINTTAPDPQTNQEFRNFLLEDADLVPVPLERTDLGIISEPEVSPTGSKPKMSVEDFELIRVIGKGSFGKVTLVRKKDSAKLYAMKVLSKPNIVRRKQVEHTRTERRVLGQINHPFIVRLHFAFQTDQKLYFVLDFCAGGELFFHLSRMKKFPEHMARFYAGEITLALECLHQSGIIYRDLKPENILLDETGHVKLADFGLAKEGITDATAGAHSLCGTPEYLSPEVLDRQGHGTAVDWWNLGMVTYEMLTGLPPWYTTDRQKLFERLRRASLKFPFYVSRPAASLIQALLMRDPGERLGSNGASEVKAHAFFSSVDWEALYERRVTPPFNPCRSQEVKETSNFEKEFTTMPLTSVDETRNETLHERGISDTFQNFTFEAPSALEAHLAVESTNVGPR